MIDEAVVSAEENMTRSCAALFDETMVEILKMIKFRIIVAASTI